MVEIDNIVFRSDNAMEFPTIIFNHLPIFNDGYYTVELGPETSKISIMRYLLNVIKDKNFIRDYLFERATHNYEPGGQFDEHLKKDRKFNFKIFWESKELYILVSTMIDGEPTKNFVIELSHVFADSEKDSE